MGQNSSANKVVVDGNLENDQMIGKRIRKIGRRKSLKDLKEVVTLARKVASSSKAEMNWRDSKKVEKKESAGMVDLKKKKVEKQLLEKVAQQKAISTSSPPEESKVAAEEVEEKKVTGVQEFDLYAVDYSHVHLSVTEFADTVEVTNKHSAEQLPDLLKKMKLSDAEMKEWGKRFSSGCNSVANATNSLSTVVKYAETGKCTPAVKKKLRVVTKMVMESKNPKDMAGIVLLLASHGNVCNVMKEVAIKNAYAMLTGNLKEFVQSQSLEEQIIRQLQSFRVLCIEKLFHKFGFSNNTHYVAGFHNTMAKEVGVVPYNDPNICYPSTSRHPHWKEHLHLRFFKETYTKEEILKWLQTQIEENKIAYQRVVRWFEKRVPEDESTSDFLAKIIDIETGKFDPKYLCWMLQQMGIFQVKGAAWKDIEKCWK